MKEDIKETVKNVARGQHGLMAIAAGVAAGFVAKRFSKDAAGSVGAGLVVYSLVKRI